MTEQIKNLQDKMSEEEGRLAGAADLAQTIQQLMAAEVEAISTTPFDAATYLSLNLNSIAASDVDNALVHIRWAWNDNGPCTQFFLCLTYIDSAGISFSDGNFGVFVNIQRLTTSAHDCIVNAKKAKSEGNKAMAVQWVIASQIHNRPVYDWLKGHGDAVITALDMVP